MNLIESKIYSYTDTKYPFLYYIQFFTIPLSLLFWILGFIFGVYVLLTDTNIGIAFWLIGWIFGGVIIFYFLNRKKIGTQTITFDHEGIRITQGFGFIRFTKLIKRNKIQSIGINEFDPFNPLTGVDIKMNKKFGRILINDQLDYSNLYSFLYPIRDLQIFIEEFEKSYLNN